MKMQSKEFNESESPEGKVFNWIKVTTVKIYAITIKFNCFQPIYRWRQVKSHTKRTNATIQKVFQKKYKLSTKINNFSQYSQSLAIFLFPSSFFTKWKVFMFMWQQRVSCRTIIYLVWFVWYYVYEDNIRL